MIEQYGQPFDPALALHARGNATAGHVLLKAASQRAAFFVSPCCMGWRQGTPPTPPEGRRAHRVS
jgi:hypothetical protein